MNVTTRRSVLALIAVLPLLSSETLVAQERTRLAVCADVMIPQVEFKKTALTGFGALAQLQVPLSGRLASSFSVGLASWSAKGGSGIVLKGVPLRGGLKLFLSSGSGNQFYVGGEVGAFVDVTTTKAMSHLLYGPIVGMEFPVGSRTGVDLSGRYDVISGSESRIENVGIRLGVSFVL